MVERAQRESEDYPAWSKPRGVEYSTPAVPHRGFDDTACYGSNKAVESLLALLYKGIPLPENPLSSRVREQTERNTEICRRYEAGESITDLAQAFGLSLQRISEIVHQNKK